MPGRTLALLLLLVPVVSAVAAFELAPAPRTIERGVFVDRRILEEIRERNELLPNLRHLSDEIGPRLTGSANLEKANRWAAERMKESGLTSVRLEPWEIPVGWERGSATMKLVEPDTGRGLTVAARGWTPGTSSKTTGPVVLLEAKTKDDLARYKGKLRNAVVLNGPPADVKPVTDLTYGPSRPRTAEEPKKPDPAAKDPPRPPLSELQAFRRELAAFLKSEDAAVLVADAAKPHGLLITTGAWRDGDRGTEQDPMPAVYMAHEHYALLHRLATRPGNPPTRVEVEISNKFVPGPVTVYNTVGEVVGREKPEEFVVVGAHLDSWDLATGTTDNGTGSCVVLEVARAVAALAKAGYPPRRTIKFVLFTGEEQGLHGSKQFAKKHKDSLARMSAAIVHDTGTGVVQGFGLQGREAVRKVLEPELEVLSTVPGWKGVDLTSSGGTDHLSFEAVGVPGFACRQDMDEYRLTHHTQSDTFDKAKGANLVQGAQCVAVAAVRIANLPELLPREKPKK